MWEIVQWAAVLLFSILMVWGAVLAIVSACRLYLDIWQALRWALRKRGK